VLDIGDTIATRTLTTIDGTDVAVPAADSVVHLQFRRFAGCPICSLHLREVARRHQEIADAGVREVVLFHSSADQLREYQADLPFAVVADPDRLVYTEFGVGSSLAAVLHPGAFAAAVRGLRHTGFKGALSPGEDHAGKPADFLIDPDGTVRARKYGAHADDQWSVDDLLALAAR
jgi:peroxiredoxin